MPRHGLCVHYTSVASEWHAGVHHADLARLEDCKQELHSILQEERLFGATLLVMANKQDLPSALRLEELQQVGRCCFGRASHGPPP